MTLTCSWDEKNGLESHGSPSVVSWLAVLTSPGHLLDKQILRPHCRPLNQRLGLGPSNLSLHTISRWVSWSSSLRTTDQGAGVTSPISSLHPATKTEVCTIMVSVQARSAPSARSSLQEDIFFPETERVGRGQMMSSCRPITKAMTS